MELERRVAILVRKGVIKLVKEKLPKLKDKEVLIKVKACGICTGDLYAFKGLPTWYKLPAAIGHEPSGIVIEVGKKVEKLKPGDRVTALATPAFSDYVIAHEDDVVKIPDNILFEYALGEPLACVVNGVRLAHPKFGDNVAIVGTGFMGLLLIQALSHMGLDNLIGIDIRDDRLELAKEFGATFVINSSNEDICIKEVLDITNGIGCDVVIEATGNPRGVNLASKLIKKKGRLCIFSYHSLPVQVDFKIWDAKGLEIIMTCPARAEDMRRNLKIAIKMLGRGIFKLEKLVTHKWKLEEIQKAFEYAAKKPSSYIKGVIIP